MFNLTGGNMECPVTYIFLKVTYMIKNLPARQEIWVWSLGWEDPLEKGTATHSSSLAWRIPWTEEPGGLQSMGLHRAGHDWATSLSLTHSSSLAWRIPWIEEPGGLQSMGLHRAGHDWVTFALIHSIYLSIPISHPTWYPCLCSLYLCLYFCFIIRLSMPVVSDSTYIR